MVLGDMQTTLLYFLMWMRKSLRTFFVKPSILSVWEIRPNQLFTGDWS